EKTARRGEVVEDLQWRILDQLKGSRNTLVTEIVCPQSSAEHRLSHAGHIPGKSDRRRQLEAGRFVTGEGNTGIVLVSLDAGVCRNRGRGAVLGRIEDRNVSLLVVPPAEVVDAQAVVYREAAGDPPVIQEVKVGLVGGKVQLESFGALREHGNVAHEQVCVAVAGERVPRGLGDATLIQVAVVARALPPGNAAVVITGLDEVRAQYLRDIFRQRVCPLWRILIRYHSTLVEDVGDACGFGIAADVGNDAQTVVIDAVVRVTELGRRNVLGRRK